jgi:hypothetical protein
VFGTGRIMPSLSFMLLILLVFCFVYEGTLVAFLSCTELRSTVSSLRKCRRCVQGSSERGDAVEWLLTSG